MADHILLSGGPLDGDHHGPLAWSIARENPAYFCTQNDDLVWHHYVADRQAAPAPVLRFVHAGVCTDVGPAGHPGGYGPDSSAGDGVDHHPDLCGSDHFQGPGCGR